MNDRTDAVLASIDGALMDPEIPDGMRWSPAPEHAFDPTAVPYDGAVVPQPHQRYEADQPASRLYLSTSCCNLTHATCTDADHCFCTCHDAAPILSPEDPRWSVRRGGVRFEPHSDAEPPRAPSSHPLPPGASMLLGQLRADRADLLAERARLIAEGVPPSALVEPVDPDGLRRSVRDAIQADLTARAERINDDARAMRPRVSDHTSLLRGRGRYDESGLLIVEEYESGLTTVRRVSPEEAGEILRQTWEGLVEAFRPIFEQIGETLRNAGDTLRRAGLVPDAPPIPPPDARQAALDARRHRSVGPAPLGPERSPRPRTHR